MTRLVASSTYTPFAVSGLSASEELHPEIMAAITAAAIPRPTTFLCIISSLPIFNSPWLYHGRYLIPEILQEMLSLFVFSKSHPACRIPQKPDPCFSSCIIRDIFPYLPPEFPEKTRNSISLCSDAERKYSMMIISAPPRYSVHGHSADIYKTVSQLIHHAFPVGHQSTIVTLTKSSSFPNFSVSSRPLIAII